MADLNRTLPGWFGYFKNVKASGALPPEALGLRWFLHRFRGGRPTQ